MRKIWKIFSGCGIVVVIFTVSFVSFAFGATITMTIAPTEIISTSGRQSGDDTAEIYIEGDISSGDEEKLQNLIARLQTIEHFTQDQFAWSTVRLNSNGGSVQAAIRIAEAISHAQLSTDVGAYDRCLSACVFIWISGRIKWADGSAFFGVHQSAIFGVATQEGTLGGAKFLRRRGCPVSVTDRMLLTPPNQIYILSPAQLRACGGWVSWGRGEQ